MFSSFTLKIIAIFCMTCDHISLSLFHKATFLNLIGRIAFPIFAFQITQGYINTKNLKKYFIRLFVFALISQIPFMLFKSTYTSGFTLNIFFTLTLGLLSIYIYDKLNNKFLSIFIGIVISTIAELIHVDYGYWGVFIILIFYIFKDKKILTFILYTLLCIIKYLPYLINYNFHYIYLLHLLFTIIPIIFILLYNKKQGPKIKYLLYIFYPLHMLILYFINIAIL